MNPRHLNRSGRLQEKIAGRSAGFTLIELLIVISIIAILALVAVASYTGVQRQASVDFAADTLVATIREAQDWSRSGRREVVQDVGAAGGDRSYALCYAVKVVTGAGEGAGLYSAQTRYISVEGETVDSCTSVEESGWRKSDVFNDRIALIRASVGGLGDVDTEIYYFKPPFGKILTEEGGVLMAVASRTITFVIGDPDYTEWNRSVNFDLSTGEVKKVKTVE